MATLNRDSGKSMLIRNCVCGSKPESRHYKNVYGVGYHAYQIKCSSCGRSLLEGYTEESKEDRIASVINLWNIQIK